MSDTPLPIAEQAKKIEEDCERAAIRDALVSSRWDKRNVTLGLSSTVAAATASFLAGGGNDLVGLLSPDAAKAVAALSALVAAGLASTLTFLAPAEKANAFQHTSNQYFSLRERLRFFRHTSCPSSPANLGEQLQTLMTEKHEVDGDHPIVPEWAYEKAQKKIEEKIRRNQKLESLRARPAGEN
jgi:hypothetical protein